MLSVNTIMLMSIEITIVVITNVYIATSDSKVYKSNYLNCQQNMLCDTMQKQLKTCLSILYRYIYKSHQYKLLNKI